MKKGLLPAISIGIAVLVIGSIAYATDRRKNYKTSDIFADKIHEEEALKEELLKADEHDDKFLSEIEKISMTTVLEDNHNESDLLAEVVKPDSR